MQTDVLYYYGTVETSWLVYWYSSSCVDAPCFRCVNTWNCCHVTTSTSSCRSLKLKRNYLLFHCKLLKEWHTWPKRSLCIEIWQQGIACKISCNSMLIISITYNYPHNYRIDSNFVIKVSDFGLSEDVYQKNYFRQAKDDSVKLPIKWMAPESMSDGIFTEKTDVVGWILSEATKFCNRWCRLWISATLIIYSPACPNSSDNSNTGGIPILHDCTFWTRVQSNMWLSFTQWSFGITCWEVFSGGKSPYPGIDPASVIKMLEAGNRLDKPLNAACCDST